MRAALRLARRGLGGVWPNPAVGCVLVKDGRVLARGWTQDGGRPHAEAEALRHADGAASSATAYITLEPCAHHGATPPCAEALVSAAIRRAVIAVRDPDSRVNGKGCATLRRAGIDVLEHVCKEEAVAVNAGFFSRIKSGRPLVTLKLATTIDGRIATGGGDSRWITGEGARARAHQLRASADAVMVGVGTILADDPELTCRLSGLEKHSPVRIVADTKLRIPLTAKIIQGALTVPTWIITMTGANEGRRAKLAAHGAEVIEVSAGPNGSIDMGAAMQALGKRGLTRLLVEGGGRVAAALLRCSLVDRMAWFHAPKVVGSDGTSAVAALGVNAIGDAPLFQRLSSDEIGDDILSQLARHD